MEAGLAHHGGDQGALATGGRDLTLPLEAAAEGVVVATGLGQGLPVAGHPSGQCQQLESYSWGKS